VSGKTREKESQKVRMRRVLTVAQLVVVGAVRFNVILKTENNKEF
jgi:hypothetical protein